MDGSPYIPSLQLGEDPKTMDGFPYTVGTMSALCCYRVAVFVCWSGRPLYILIYVDDLFLVGNRAFIEHFKKELKRKFDVEELGPVTNFLGMEFEITRDFIKLHQNQQCLPSRQYIFPYTYQVDYVV